MTLDDLTVNGVHLIINKGCHLLVGEVVCFLTRSPVQVGTQRRDGLLAGHGFAGLPATRDARGEVIVGQHQVLRRKLPPVVLLDCLR
jgi:hypothetical protein